MGKGFVRTGQCLTHRAAHAGAHEAVGLGRHDEVVRVVAVVHEVLEHDRMAAVSDPAHCSVGPTLAAIRLTHRCRLRLRSQ